MKLNKDFQAKRGAEVVKKAPKLDPIRKSGKERHSLYKAMEEDDDEGLFPLHKRESAYDYMEPEVSEDSEPEEPADGE